VTPTTAELLMWWFGEDMVIARGGLNFHAGQKQAILNAIVAHEVLGQGHKHWSLLDLYRNCAPDALLTGTRLNEVAQAKHAHPKYCFKMATGTGKTWVLQALMIWQLLNKTAAVPRGITCCWRKTWLLSGKPKARAWPSCWTTRACARWRTLRCRDG
jgi:type III restriction enzyme